MALNIKTPEAHDLAREIAQITGESLTEAATVSMRERRDRLRREQGGRLTDRLIEIGRYVAGRLPEELREGDPTEQLYDEQGLPR